MNRCKTCRHWKEPGPDAHFNVLSITEPADQDTFEPMKRGFITRQCKHPEQTRFEPPVRADGFAITDGSEYFAALCTAEDFGCVLHETA